MGLTVSSFPVKEAGKNIFAGEEEVNIVFKREDISVVSTEQGIDGTLLINLNGDVSNELNIGEWIYLKSELYDSTCQVLEIGTNQLRVDKQWVGNEEESGGYVNYKQNYFVELDVTDSVNYLIKTIPFTLRDSGTPNGIIDIDLAIINDLNVLKFPMFNEIYEMQSSRIKFKVRYREVYRELTNDYAAIDDAIIIIPARKIGKIEGFNNNFDEPKYYSNYPNGATYLHSDSDPEANDNIIMYYDELDINKDTIKENTEMGRIGARTSYGNIFLPLITLRLLNNTEYISLDVKNTALQQFSDEFSNEFKKN